jgi:hypothetical protein
MMNKILFASPHYFSGYIQVGGHHYAKVLSRNNWKVLYCSLYLSPFTLLLGKDRKDINSRFSNHIHGGEYINENLLSYVPFTLLPHHNLTIFDKKWFLYNSYRFTVPSVAGVLQKHGFEDVDVLWLDGPYQIFWKNTIRYRKSIYRIYDAVEQFPNTGKNILDAHEEAIASSDVVIVTSKVLTNELSNKYKNVNFLHCPNGVDLSNFLKTDYQEPEEYRGFKGRKALYVGAIDEWFDEDLLMYVADHSQDTNFMIIGPDRSGKMDSVKRPNIYYLGPRPYSDIPDYMFYADFGIIPFKSTKLVRCVNPIKMYEYFSLGKQVVSTSWEELQLSGVPCLLAKNNKDFLGFINSHEVLNPDRDYLIRYAKENTWENRLRNTLKLITDN